MGMAARAGGWTPVASLHGSGEGGKDFVESLSFAVRAFGRLIGKRACEEVKGLPAFFATIFVNRHDGPDLLLDHVINETVLSGLFGGHEVIAFGVGEDAFDRLTGVIGQDFV